MKKKRSNLFAYQIFSVGFCEVGNLSLIAAGMSFPVKTIPILLPSFDIVQLMTS